MAFLSFRLHVLAALALFLLAGVGDAAAARCFSLGEAQRYVMDGRVLRLGAIVRAIGDEVVGAKLCESGGVLIYQLLVLRAGGKVDTVVVDATTGQRLR